MLVQIIEKFPDIKWKDHTSEILLNKSVPLQWIYDNNDILDKGICNDHKYEIGIDMSETNDHPYYIYDRSLDDVKFLRQHNSHLINSIQKHFDMKTYTNVDLLDYHIYLYLNNRIAQFILAIPINIAKTNYITKILDKITKHDYLYMYDVFKYLTIDELDGLISNNILDFRHLDTIIDYAIVDALYDNKNWSYIKDKISDDYKCIFMSIDQLIEDESAIKDYNWVAISTYTRISFDDIKKNHTLPWHLYDRDKIDCLMNNRHLTLSNIAELFYEYINIDKTNLKFIRDVALYHVDSYLIDAICKRYDLTTELVKEYFEPQHYIHFIKHPAVNPFKLYCDINIKLPITEMLGNPSSYETIYKYIHLTDDLSYLVTNEFDDDKVYKKVKLYRKKQDDLSRIIIESIDLPLVINNIIVLYHIFQ